MKKCKVFNLYKTSKGETLRKVYDPLEPFFEFNCEFNSELIAEAFGFNVSIQCSVAILSSHKMNISIILKSFAEELVHRVSFFKQIVSFSTLFDCYNLNWHHYMLVFLESLSKF